MQNKKEWIDKIFKYNPVMNEIYPDGSRYILEPFCIENAWIEYFDLSTHPITREFSKIGNANPTLKGFEITNACLSALRIML